jgi:phosphoribosylformimino-5-aminoimidazole carboxamide ribonucleotide (ProFAR) isomerase
MKDIRNIAKAESFGIEGVIVGRAIYENRIKLREAIVEFQNGA